MSFTYMCLLALMLTPLMANGRPTAESISTSSRETRQYMPPVPAPWLTPYGFRQQNFGRYPSPAATVQERFGLALLLSLLGGGGSSGGGDDRNPWNFRPLANFQQQMANPQPFFWPVTTTLG